VVEPARLEEVLAVCARWEVRATPIGAVTELGRLRAFDGDELVGDIPVSALVDDCPLYDLAPDEPPVPPYPTAPRKIAADASVRESLLALLASPTIASKRWAFEQYDCLVGSRTVRRPDTADAAVLSLAVDGGDGAIAVAIDGNGRRVACDPYTGAAEAVLECAQNLACVGATPLGLTNCLNFGNPEKPHIAWQLTRAVDGLAAACRALGIPVVGGNVSLYNEGSEGPIYPTPIVGIVGRLQRPEHAPCTGFQQEGHAVALVGPFSPELAGSELAKLRGLPLPSGLRALDLDAHTAALELIRSAAADGALATAHDVSEGGLASALAECCAGGRIGADVNLADVATALTTPGEGDAELTAEELLFGEGAGGYVVAGETAAIDALERSAVGVRVIRIGTVGGDSLAVGCPILAGTLEISVGDLDAARESGLPDHLS
jgi:phosphoribosylformylglycinamidine synthase